ncbi:uncharacterized protein DUF2590 [Volucribacter psittacicida]|uniref:Uncharacterized protein DUF2590 n=1 Tax=Volucribacter psittacicida TaxID=203482 RepID=A0A4V2PBU9_9PAST|nr:DUF2590 family protein [Volucribacter psittacicida]TCJ98835.1 uncharacterized protein DUF2590 [Volucribacter psittacicida]
MQELYLDLLITDEDITLDSGNMPIICNNRISIAQDIKHAILESGLVTLLIGERSRILRRDIILRIILLVEEDQRLIPGSISITEESHNRLFLTSETYDFGTITQGISYE